MLMPPPLITAISHAYSVSARVGYGPSLQNHVPMQMCMVHTKTLSWTPWESFDETRSLHV